MLKKNYLSSLSKSFILILFLLASTGAFGQRVFGTLKTTGVFDLKEKQTRFALDNARVGVRGGYDIVSYFFQTELSSNGKFTLLDVLAQMKIAQGFHVTVGQQPMPLPDESIIIPGQMGFSTLPYLFPFAYADARDIGANFSYSFVDAADFPLSADIGAFNGTGINNPTWQDQPSMAARLQYGYMHRGFRTALKYYTSVDKEKPGAIKMHAIALQYSSNNGKWKIESEWSTTDSLNNKETSMSAYFLQGKYRFRTDNFAFAYVMPTARVESIGNKVFDNGFSLNRATIGVDFGLKTSMDARIRLNYEKVLTRSGYEGKIPHALEFGNRTLNDKIIIELLLNF